MIRTWKRFAESGATTAVQASEDVVPASQLRDAHAKIRELEHAVQRATILAREATISANDLGLPDGAVSLTQGFPAEGTLADLERYWILTTLARCDGNQSTTSQALGIDRSTLHRKLRQYGEGDHKA